MNEIGTSFAAGHTSAKDFEHYIHETIKIIRSIDDLSSPDARQTRLDLDALLSIWEQRW